MLGALKNAVRPILAPYMRARSPRSADERQRSVADLEDLFLELCRELRPDLFIEAGAKDAATSRKVRGCLPDARVVAFEANPVTFERSRRRTDYGSHGVEYLHQTLSDAEGTVTFNVRVVNGKLAADGRGSILARNRTNIETRPFEVPSRRLDGVFPPGSFGSCAIWIDVEGASRQVLTGAEAILRQAGSVFIEVEEREVWKGQWLAREVSDYLGRHGLTAIGRDFQSRHQHNVVFVRRSALTDARIESLRSRLRRRARL